MQGTHVLYAIASALPLTLVWYGVLTLWKHRRGDGNAPRSFSIWSGALAIALSLLLQFQMTPQTRIPGPDRHLEPYFWLLSLGLFTYGTVAFGVGLFLFSRTAGTRPDRVTHCDRCGNRESLHTEYCVKCGARFVARREQVERIA